MVYLVKFLAILTFLAVNAHATVLPGVNNVVQVGHAVNSDNPCLITPAGSLGSPQVVTLSASVAGSTANNFLMFTQWNTNAGQYQVPSGKILKVCTLFVFCSTTSDHIGMGYGTAALGSDNTATPPAGVKYFSSGATIPILVLGAGGLTNTYPFYAEFPALSYPFLITSQGSVTYSAQLVGVVQ